MEPVPSKRSAQTCQRAAADIAGLVIFLGAGFGLVVILILHLMVFKPGS